MTRLADWLQETSELLRAAGIGTPVRDARLLAQLGCGLAASEVLTQPDRPVLEAEATRLQALRHRRLQREPVSRIAGRRGFMALDLEITPATLDPRPDTETLVEAVVEVLREEARATAPLEIVDLGTGSGAILIALLRALPQARGLGIDISAEALRVAARNISAHGMADRAQLGEGSWLEGSDATFDVIVSNPPYLPTAEIATLEREVTDYDPRLALDGGDDGLAAYRIIIDQAPTHLRAGGWLFLEHGAGQQDAVAAMLDPDGAARGSGRLRCFRDLSGRSRCVAKWHQLAGLSSKK